MLKIRTYIIHLERAWQRSRQVDVIRRACPTESEVVPAVDGGTLSTTTSNSVYSPGRFLPRYPFTLRVSEIATFLSHRRCWERLVNQRLDAALVLEDDAHLDTPAFARAFRLAARSLEPGKIIRFPVKDRERPTRIVANDGPVRVFRPRITGLGMQGLLVHRDAAKRLLGLTETFDRPVDTLLQMTWLTGVSTLSVVPSGLSEVSERLGGSLIGKGKGVLETLHREVMRPIYRFRVANRACATGG